MLMHNMHLPMRGESGHGACSCSMSPLHLPPSLASDSHVTCVISEDCVLPCAFQPSSHEVVRWFLQDVLVKSFQSADSMEQGEGEQNDGDNGSDEDSEEKPGHEHGHRHHHDDHAILFPDLVARGNATLVIRGCGPKDRGRYRCHVRTSAGVHESHVIVKVEGESWYRHLIHILSEDTYICVIESFHNSFELLHHNLP